MSTPRSYKDPRPKADPVRAYKDQIDALHLKVEGLQRQLAAGCPRCASTGDDWTDFHAQRGKYAPRTTPTTTQEP